MSLLSLAPADMAVCEGAATFLQSRFWGEFKAQSGWTAFAFSVMLEAASPPGAAPRPEPLLVLYRRLAPLFGFAYVPWGPPAAHDGLAELARRLEELARGLRGLLPKDTVCIRFDLPWMSEDPAVVDARGTRGYLGKAFIPAAASVQPPDTVIIDVTAGEDELLGRMKSKWRYNIALAEKKGVAVRRYAAGEIAGEPLASYYRLYRETAGRDGIGIHGEGYYRALFEASARSAGGPDPVEFRLYLASHEGEDIAGIVTLFRKNEAVYLYGASASHKRNLMAPYALQWKAMLDAKAAGCVFYDLYGIPPRSAEEEPGHPMAGLYRFKTGFGGRIVHRPGCQDYACRPLLYALYREAEAARKKLRDMRKRRPRL